jgi:hypothetical protein
MSPDVNGDTFDKVFGDKEKAQNYIDEQHNPKAYRIIQKKVKTNE